MKIDEAIKVLNKYNYEEVTMYEPEWDAINTLVRLAEWYKEQEIKNKYGAQADAIARMEQKLNWWREQDLIQRKDIINPIRYCHSDDISYCRDRRCSECYQEEIMKIPKAEPPNHIGEVTETVNRHCETCIRFTDDDCTECNVCGDGVDYYEPYIPKENEQ